MYLSKSKYEQRAMIMGKFVTVKKISNYPNFQGNNLILQIKYK